MKKTTFKIDFWPNKIFLLKLFPLLNFFQSQLKKAKQRKKNVVVPRGSKQIDVSHFNDKKIYWEND